MSLMWTRILSYKPHYRAICIDKAQVRDTKKETVPIVHNSAICIFIGNSLSANSLGNRVDFVYLVRNNSTIGSVKRGSIAYGDSGRFNFMHGYHGTDRKFRLHGAGEHRIGHISEYSGNQRNSRKGDDEQGCNIAGNRN